MTTDLKPGIFPNLSYDEYESWEALRHSTLEKFRRTPAHAREAILNPRKETEALFFGHAFHTALLERERYVRDFYTLPAIDPATGKKLNLTYNSGKAIVKALEEQHPGGVALKADMAKDIAGMCAAIQAHETAAALLAEGESELSMVWKDGKTGETLKARTDHKGLLGRQKWLVDVKSTEDASEDSFRHAIWDYGYHRQLAMYRSGWMTLAPDEYQCAIIACEKKAPYCVQVFLLDERCLEQGGREWRAHLDQFIHCRDTQSWPAYGYGMTLVDLPRKHIDTQVTA